MCFNILEKANKLDTYILSTVNKHIQNKYLDIIMPIITKSENLETVWIAMAIILLLDKPYRMIGIIVLITLVLSTIIGEGLIKHLVKRIRPYNSGCDIKLLITKPISYSFPSGHTLSSFAVADVLSVYFPDYKLIFIGIAFIIAVSRIYLYAHYPTDVIFGVILGLLCAKLVLNGLQKGYFQKFIVIYRTIS